jgi:hypothetical protein
VTVVDLLDVAGRQELGHALGNERNEIKAKRVAGLAVKLASEIQVGAEDARED